MPFQEPPQMLNVNEAAARLHVHANTIRRWTDEGLLECFRVGTGQHRRFTETHIDAFLKKPYVTD